MDDEVSRVLSLGVGFTLTSAAWWKWQEVGAYT